MSDTAFSGAAALLDAPAAPPVPADPAVGADPNLAPIDPAAPPAPVDKPWFDNLSDPELKGWAENKGYKSPEELALAHRGLEKLLGAEKLPLPKDENDKEGWDRVHKALGRPDTPEGYGLKDLAGADPEFAGAVSIWLHEAGMGHKGAAALAEKWNAYMGAQTEAAQKAFETQSKLDMADLRTEWGASAEAELEHFKRGARQFGVSADEMKSIETQLGTKRAVSLFAKIGAGLGEAEFIEGDGVKQFGMTAAAATARRTALMADKEWAGRYLSGNNAEKTEMERLNRIIAGEA